MALAKANLRLLTERVNERLGETHSETYVSEVRSGKKGSSALKDIVNQEEAKLLREAAEALT